jgi:hypothetical protein
VFQGGTKLGWEAMIPYLVRLLEITVKMLLFQVTKEIIFFFFFFFFFFLFY